MSQAPPARSRNARGQGARLREDILLAAREILLEEGYEAAITLRGVARRIGIAAPSIYPHFSGPEAIVQAVVVETFAQLGAAIDAAKIGIDDPEERLLAGCRAYMTFGIDHVNLYKLMFTRNRQQGGRSPEGRPVDVDDLRVGAFGRLVTGVQDCMNAGISTAVSAPLTALEIWVAMHGLVSLRGAQYDMPWPPRDVIEPSLVLALARIQH